MKWRMMIDQNDLLWQAIIVAERAVMLTAVMVAAHFIHFI